MNTNKIMMNGVCHPYMVRGWKFNDYKDYHKCLKRYRSLGKKYIKKNPAIKDPDAIWIEFVKLQVIFTNKYPKKNSREIMELSFKELEKRAKMSPRQIKLAQSQDRLKIKQIEDSTRTSITGKPLKPCSFQPLTGYMRDGYCYGGPDDMGKHNVCAIMDEDFLRYTASRGNDLSSVVSPGDRWCLCQDRYMEAVRSRKAPKIVLDATWSGVKQQVKEHLKISNNKK